MLLSSRICSFLLIEIYHYTLVVKIIRHAQSFHINSKGSTYPLSHLLIQEDRRNILFLDTTNCV